MSIAPGNAVGGKNTTKTFLTALVVNGGVLALEIAVFVLLKQTLWRIYSPRTYLPPPDKRAKELPRGLWRWVPAVITSPTQDMIYKNGLDAYMFLRFLKMLIWIFLAFTILTFIVIIPIDVVNIHSPSLGLERISWSNIIDPKDQNRFYAHIVVVYTLTFFVLYMMRREMQHFVQMRHEFLTGPSHSRLPQSRTVLITSVPEELANERDLRTFASFVPGGVDRVWILRDTRQLNDIYEIRKVLCRRLEKAIAQFLKDATAARRSREKIAKAQKKKKYKDKESILPTTVVPPPTLELLNELVPLTDRPKHRIGFLGVFGEKVDTIDWCKLEIAKLNREIEIAREKAVKGRFLGSVFIRCNLQIGAHVLAQCVSYHKPLYMQQKWMDANPKDIVWKNLDDGALEMRSRAIISWLATFGLIIAWAIPVTFIGALSSLNELCLKNSKNWLRWTCDLASAPDPIPGIIQGVLPPTLLALLFILLPFILKALAWYQCLPRYSLMSVSVYRRFFLFLLVHGFLTVTLTSTITKTIRDIIETPTQTVQNLAAALPTASIFFLTYIVTQGLAGAGNSIAQLFPLILYFLRKWFLGRTPRQAYAVTFTMPAVDFGVVLPRLSLLAAIVFAYSVLSPFINLLALICFLMYYVSWKFLLLQVCDQPDEVETGGLYFPMAISNLFVGLYIEQICLACLFFLKITEARKAAIVEGTLMLALIGITAAVHGVLNNSFKPITAFLPMSLATKQLADNYQRHKKLDAPVLTEEEEEQMFYHKFKKVGRKLKQTAQKLDDTLGNLKAKAMGEGHAGPSAKFGKDEKSETSALPSHSAELRRQGSDASKASSAASHQSHEALKTPDDVPIISPLTPLGESDDEGQNDEEDEDDIHAFDHPSTYAAQPWIWIPRDPSGYSEILIQQLKDCGVEASDVGATMDEKGVVEVSRNPPDRRWAGGHDR